MQLFYVLFDLFLLIFGICTSRVITSAKIYALNELVKCFLELFESVFGWENLTFNFHFLDHLPMDHLPMMLEYFGP
jgi:hypothetical protein